MNLRRHTGNWHIPAAWCLSDGSCLQQQVATWVSNNTWAPSKQQAFRPRTSDRAQLDAAGHVVVKEDPSTFAVALDDGVEGLRTEAVTCPTHSRPPLVTMWHQHQSRTPGDRRRRRSATHPCCWWLGSSHEAQRSHFCPGRTSWSSASSRWAPQRAPWTRWSSSCRCNLSVGAQVKAQQPERDSGYNKRLSQSYKDTSSMAIMILHVSKLKAAKENTS